MTSLPAMRRALHMFALLMLLLGGTHLLEPAEARAELAGSLHCAAGQLCDELPAGESDESAHAGHHHCPLAVDQLAGPGAFSRPAAGAVFVLRVAPLASRAQAPPIEPPAA